MGECRFTLFNRELRIISENADNERLKMLVALFTEKIEDLRRMTKEEDPVKVLVFLGLNLLDENHRLRKDDFSAKLPNANEDAPEAPDAAVAPDDGMDVQDRAEALVNKIRKVLDND